MNQPRYRRYHFKSGGTVDAPEHYDCQNFIAVYQTLFMKFSKQPIRNDENVDRSHF